MVGVNKVILLGRAGKDAEVRQTLHGNPVANFSLATSEAWTDKGGKRMERTEWHNIVVWGSLAEICGRFITKGKQVYIEGKLQTREWQDKSGAKRYTTEINATSVQFLGGGRGEQDQHGFDDSDFGSGAVG